MRIGCPRDTTHRIHLHGSSVSNALRFFSWTDSVETGAQSGNCLFAPGRAFRVVGYGAKCQLAPGSTVLALHRNASGTADESVTENPGAADTWIHAETSLDFDSTDTLALGITATNYPADVWAYLELVWL